MGTKRRALKALDLFAGAGGFSIGAKNAGVDIIASVEFNNKISETYKYNNKQTIVINHDIQEIQASENDTEKDTYIKIHEFNNISKIFEDKNCKCDMIIGGPPCQGFSSSGKRIRAKSKFLEDPRNFLFKEYVRMVKYLHPKIFIIENVPGILNYNDGAVKEEIFREFEKLGYNVHAKILCAADFGVPQLRNRAFFIGNNYGISSEKLFPAPKFTPKNYVTVADAISDLPKLRPGESIEKAEYSHVKPSEYQKKLRGSNKYTTNHFSSKHTNKTIEILKLIKPGQTLADLPPEFHTKSVHSGAYGRMQWNKPAYTITTRINTPSVGVITHPEENRTISPREAARIQSFPDDYEFLGDITSIGMQIGNAVPPILAEEIISNIIKTLEKYNLE